MASSPALPAAVGKIILKREDIRGFLNGLLQLELKPLDGGRVIHRVGSTTNSHNEWKVAVGRYCIVAKLPILPGLPVCGKSPPIQIHVTAFETTHLTCSIDETPGIQPIVKLGVDANNQATQCLPHHHHHQIVPDVQPSKIHHPSMWAISLEQLWDIYHEAEERFGTKFFSQMTMRDIVSKLIQPKCKETGKSYALQRNPQGLKLDVFVTHSWDGVFQTFVHSIDAAFGNRPSSSSRGPNLWICSFALRQGDGATIQAQLGGDDDDLSTSPFVQALRAADQFLVVRNPTTDLYSRIWCVCELVYAREFHLIPPIVVGPNNFSDRRTSCRDAQSSNQEDQRRILRMIDAEYDYREIDDWINRIRQV